MPKWFMPTLKTVLPHVATIVSAAAPAFTRRAGEAGGRAPLLGQQIGELQAAAAQNAQHVRELAAQLRTALTALEQAALASERALRRLFLVCLTALGLSAAALAVALLVLWRG